MLSFTALCSHVMFYSDAYTDTADHLTVVLMDVRCDGTETSIFQCPSNGWLKVSSSCKTHSKDAGVFCYKHGMYTLSLWSTKEMI